MAKKKSVERLFRNELSNRIAYGQSKHKDKQELKFGQSTYKIYSFSTYNTYTKEIEQYAKWLQSEKGINKIKDIYETEQFAKEYLQSRLDKGISVWTVKMERSALGMLYNQIIDIKMPIRDKKEIIRSRQEKAYTKHISREGKHKDIFTIAVSTGCRRKDIGKLTVNSFIEKNGHLYVKILQSKGGRDRIAPVVPNLQEEVKVILEKAKAERREKLFDVIPQKIDIHGLRREYAQNIYNTFVIDKAFRDDYLKLIGKTEYHEYRTFKDADGNTHIREVMRTIYKDRQGNCFDVMDLSSLSQSLGHNRLDVSLGYIQ